MECVKITYKEEGARGFFRGKIVETETKKKCLHQKLKMKLNIKNKNKSKLLFRNDTSPNYCQCHQIRILFDL